VATGLVFGEQGGEIGGGDATSGVGGEFAVQDVAEVDGGLDGYVGAHAEVGCHLALR